MNDKKSPESPEKDFADEKDVIKEENIGEVRHDEPITAKDIVRSMFMANEPEQRMEVDHADDRKDTEPGN